MASRIPSVRRLYKFDKGTIIDKEGSHLPESYKKFYREWKLTKAEPVHYIPHQQEWQRDPNTGEVKRVENVDIRLLFPPESHQGIWGGEGVVKGFQKRSPNKQRVPHFWVPNLIQSVVYSEILDKRFSVTVTERTIDLIIKNHGFDHYILKTKACDLQSGLAVKLKRKLLLSLFERSLCPADPVKAEQVYNKYKHYLNEYTKEDIDWYGWTIDEALRKWKDHNQKEPVPLKIQLRQKFLSDLAAAKENPEPVVEEPTEKRSWMNRINPFSNK